MGEASLEEVRMIKALMDRFAKHTGLVINPDK
jgi:hypothetical protein